MNRDELQKIDPIHQSVIQFCLLLIPICYLLKIALDGTCYTDVVWWKECKQRVGNGNTKQLQLYMLDLPPQVQDSYIQLSLPMR